MNNKKNHIFMWFFYSICSQICSSKIIFPQCLQWLASFSCFFKPQCLHITCFFIGRKITLKSLRNNQTHKVIIIIASHWPVFQTTTISQKPVVVRVESVKYKASVKLFILSFMSTWARNTKLDIKNIKITKLTTEKKISLFFAKK